LGCAGCAQLAGFEDLTGAGAESSGGASGGVSPTGGAPAGGGRTGGSAGLGPVQSAGSSSDGGDSSSVDGGAAGDANGGRVAVTGGKANGGSSAGGNGNSGGASGGSANGGAATGGTASGGTASGGTATGGTATGGTGTGGTATGACGELLLNGDFASADSGWTVDSSYLNFERDVHPIIAAGDDLLLLLEGVEPYSDDHLAWVGGVPNDDRGYSVSFSQTIVIPEDVTELAFTGFIRIQTSEPENDDVYDRVFLELLDLEEEFVWQFTAQSNLQAGDAWVEIDPTDPDTSNLSFLRGRTLIFTGYSLTDDAGPTHFFFDSLSLIATCDQ
jgi:hypothetical protein